MIQLTLTSCSKTYSCQLWCSRNSSAYECLLPSPSWTCLWTKTTIRWRDSSRMVPPQIDRTPNPTVWLATCHITLSLDVTDSTRSAHSSSEWPRHMYSEQPHLPQVPGIIVSLLLDWYWPAWFFPFISICIILVTNEVVQRQSWYNTSFIPDKIVGRKE